MSGISDDGRYVAYVKADGTQVRYDRQNDTSELYGFQPDGSPAPHYGPSSISGDGSAIAFPAADSPEARPKMLLARFSADPPPPSPKGVWAWGQNNLGQLGDGTQVARPGLPGLVFNGPSSVTDLAAAGTSLALDSAGAVWQWGVVNMEPALVPTEVAGLLPAAAVDAGRLREPGAPVEWQSVGVGAERLWPARRRDDCQSLYARSDRPDRCHGSIRRRPACAGATSKRHGDGLGPESVPPTRGRHVDQPPDPCSCARPAQQRCVDSGRYRPQPRS